MNLSLAKLMLQSTHASLVALQIKQTHTLHLLMQAESELSLIMNQYADSGEYAFTAEDNLRAKALDKDIAEYKVLLGEIVNNATDAQKSITDTLDLALGR
jgi:hypothetical protein